MPKAPGRKLKAISFADFGANFMNMVVTEQVLQKALEQAVPPTMRKKKSGVDGFDADIAISVHSVKREAGKTEQDVLRYVAPLDVKIHIRLVLLGETHDVRAEPALKFAIYCVEPLGIKIDVAPVAPASIQLLTTGGGLVHWVGQFEPKVQAAIADGVNEAVAGAEDALYIDILAKVQEAMNAPAAPQTGGGAGKPPKPVKEPILQLDGEPIEATLGEEQMMRLALPAGTEDSSEIVVLARRSEDRDEGEGEIEIKAVDEDGGKLSSWGMYVSTEDGDWSKKSEILWSHEIGSARQVFIIVKNAKPESGKAPQLDVKVKRQGT